MTAYPSVGPLVKQMIILASQRVEKKRTTYLSNAKFFQYQRRRLGKVLGSVFYVYFIPISDNSLPAASLGASLDSSLDASLGVSSSAMASETDFRAFSVAETMFWTAWNKTRLRTTI